MNNDQTFRFPSPSPFKASPTSSNEVEADDEDAPDLRGFDASPIRLSDREWQNSSSPSPVDSDSNPFSDANSQKNEVVDNDEIPRP